MMPENTNSVQRAQRLLEEAIRGIQNIVQIRKISDMSEFLSHIKVLSN